MSKLDHTLFAKWSKPAEGDKTITGCVSGQPIFIIHQVASIRQSSVYFSIQIRSGAEHASNSTTNYYAIGTPWNSSEAWGDRQPSTNVLVIIPNASNVVICLYGTTDDDNIYVYKQ